MFLHKPYKKEKIFNYINSHLINLLIGDTNRSNSKFTYSQVLLHTAKMVTKTKKQEI